MMAPFDNRAFRSWSHLVIGALVFGLLFETPIVLFDFMFDGRIFLSSASLLVGLGGFVGYLCTGAAIKSFGEVSD